MFQHFDWAVAVVGLGSNLGDRLAHLQSAIDALDAHDDIDVLGVSPVYESDPVGGPPQDPYLNAVIKVSTLLDPRELLEVAHGLEAARFRERTEHWGPRTLDVDLITFAGYRMDTSALKLPHPHAHERAFVLSPWYDLDPDASIPGHGTVRALREQVPRSGLRRRDDLNLLFVGAVGADQEQSGTGLDRPGEPTDP